MELVSQLGAVFGVLGLLIGVLLWARQKGWVSGGFSNLRASSDSRQLQVVERLPLTPQHSLCLVRVGERTLLLGISPAGISALDLPLREDHEAAV